RQENPIYNYRRNWRSLVHCSRRFSVLAREEVVVAAVGSGDDSVLALWIERLKERERHKRMYAVTMLASFGPRARGALPALIETLKDPYPEVRCLAAVALGEIGVE